MLKSRLKLEKLAPVVYATFAQRSFAHGTNPTIVSDFVRWALARGQAQVCPSTHVYLSTGDLGDLADLNDQLDTLMDAVGKLDFFLYQRHDR
jgi:hypothetical protein